MVHLCNLKMLSLRQGKEFHKAWRASCHNRDPVGRARGSDIEETAAWLERTAGSLTLVAVALESGSLFIYRQCLARTPWGAATPERRFQNATVDVLREPRWCDSSMREPSRCSCSS